MEYSADIKKLQRKLLPEDFKVTDWESLQPYFEELVNRPLNSVQDLEKWLQDISELEAVIAEDATWRQIKMTCDTENKALEEAFTYFVMEIQPKLQPYGDKLNRKFVDSEFTKQLNEDQYFTYLRSVKKKVLNFLEKKIYHFRQILL